MEIKCVFIYCDNIQDIDISVLSGKQFIIIVLLSCVHVHRLYLFDAIQIQDTTQPKYKDILEKQQQYDN